MQESLPGGQGADPPFGDLVLTAWTEQEEGFEPMVAVGGEEVGGMGATLEDAMRDWLRQAIDVMVSCWPTATLMIWDVQQPVTVHGPVQEFPDGTKYSPIHRLTLIMPRPAAGSERWMAVMLMSQETAEA